MRRVLVDTAVFAYALGAQDPRQGPAQALLKAAIEGRFSLHASVEMVQELLHHRLRKGRRREAVADASVALDACTLYPFDETVLSRAVVLVATCPGLGGRDAVHAATALVHGIDTIVSPDRGYDGVPGLRRVSIEELLAG